MIQIIEYRPEHLQSLLLQPSQAYMRGFLDKPEYRQGLEKAGPAYTAMAGDQVLACAGLVHWWQGRAEAWAILSVDLRREFLAIHHAVERFLDASHYRRIEAVIDIECMRAVRWAEMLGFACEGALAKYTPDGRDCLRYARIR